MGIKSYYYNFLNKAERRLFLEYVENKLNIKKNTFLVKLSGRNEFTTTEQICITGIILDNLWRISNFLPAPTELSLPELS